MSPSYQLVPRVHSRKDRNIKLFLGVPLVGRRSSVHRARGRPWLPYGSLMGFLRLLGTCFQLFMGFYCFIFPVNPAAQFIAWPKERDKTASTGNYLPSSCRRLTFNYSCLVSGINAKFLIVRVLYRCFFEACCCRMEIACSSICQSSPKIQEGIFGEKYKYWNMLPLVRTLISGSILAILSFVEPRISLPLFT
jgi:hypothetical protein